MFIIENLFLQSNAQYYTFVMKNVACLILAILVFIQVDSTISLGTPLLGVHVTLPSLGLLSRPQPSNQGSQLSRPSSSEEDSSNSNSSDSNSSGEDSSNQKSDEEDSSNSNSDEENSSNSNSDEEDSSNSNSDEENTSNSNSDEEDSSNSNSDEENSSNSNSDEEDSSNSNSDEENSSNSNSDEEDSSNQKSDEEDSSNQKSDEEVSSTDHESTEDGTRPDKYHKTEESEIGFLQIFTDPGKGGPFLNQLRTVSCNEALDRIDDLPENFAISAEKWFRFLSDGQESQ